MFPRRTSPEEARKFIGTRSLIVLTTSRLITLLLPGTVIPIILKRSAGSRAAVAAAGTVEVARLARPPLLLRSFTLNGLLRSRRSGGGRELRIGGRRGQGLLIVAHG